MFCQLIMAIYALQMALAAPQFVTFKDGKIGVNFGGYHADAGLGGLLTGNAAHGGLSASAGTPWGPQAAAGLNGNLDGRAAGGAYAGAQFSPDIGASSVLGGSVGNGQHGFAGAEAHSNGNTVSKSIGGMGGPSYEREYVGAPTAGPATNIDIPKTNHVQKIKPPKKYSLIRPELPSNIDHNQNDDKNIVIETINNKAIIPTVAPNFSTTTVAPHVAADSAGVIVINRRHHAAAERKHQHHQRRRMAHRHRVQHNLERTQIAYEPASAPAPAPTPTGTAESTAAVPETSTTFLDYLAARHRVKDVDAGAELAHAKQVSKTYTKSVVPSSNLYHDQQPLPNAGYHHGSAGLRVNSGLVGNVLNIPIGILRSLQESLSGIDVSKSVSYTKSV